jgi:hypothetical protein
MRARVRPSWALAHGAVCVWFAGACATEQDERGLGGRDWRARALPSRPAAPRHDAERSTDPSSRGFCHRARGEKEREREEERSAVTIAAAAAAADARPRPTPHHPRTRPQTIKQQQAAAAVKGPRAQEAAGEGGGDGRRMRLESRRVRKQRAAEGGPAARRRLEQLKTIAPVKKTNPHAPPPWHSLFENEPSCCL